MEMNETAGARLHSSEHIFVGALQKAGVKVTVIKADTFRQDGKGVLSIKENIAFSDLEKAEALANKEIQKGLLVSEKRFSDMASALRAFPKARINKERLDPDKEIRIVAIGEFDVSACKNPHVKTTKDIGPFCITKVSHPGGSTEIEFNAGQAAVEHLIRMNSMVVKAALENKFDPANLYSRFEELKTRQARNEAASEELFYRLMENARHPVLEVSEAEPKYFMGALKRFIEAHPDRYIIIVSKRQVVGMGGVNKAAEIGNLGKTLREEGAFAGDAQPDYFNGKIIDEGKLRQILKRFVY